MAKAKLVGQFEATFEVFLNPFIYKQSKMDIIGRIVSRKPGAITVKYNDPITDEEKFIELMTE